MGRAHLSSQYGIDAHIILHQSSSENTKSPSIVPKYIDRPFDLDAELPDGPDVVYEAFLSPDQIRLHENNSTVIVPVRTSAPSPIESIDTDEATTEAATTEPPFSRVTTPALPATTAANSRSAGLNVLELLEPLSTARTSALPALMQVVEDPSINNPTDQNALLGLVQRLVAILRPHINGAVEPFSSDMPDVRLLAEMFERSLIVDLVASPAGVYPRNTVMAALDELDGRAGALLVEENVEDNQDQEGDVDDDTVSDPGMDEEDLIEAASPTTTRAQSVSSPTSTMGAWSAWSGAASPTNFSSLVNRIPRPAVLSRSATPASVMDVDTDDDCAPALVPGRSVYRTTHIPSFTPRIVRASVRPSPYPTPVMVSGRSSHHDRFVPVDRLRRTPSPTR